MALKHVLLGYLIHKECSGYSLHKKFFETTRPLLPQIYRALDQMAEKGLVSSRRTVDGKLPMRNIFSVTDAGFAEFENWIKDSSDVAPIKETFFHKLWFAAVFDEEVVEALIEGIAKKREEELEYYANQEKALDVADRKFYRNLWNKLVWRLAFDYVQRRGKAEIEWAKAAVAEIRRFRSRKRSKML